jgi:hypothetical protein
MKGKLIKTGNDYLIKDTNGEVLSITNGVTDGKKLSKQNCDEIFGVVYVEKLADEYANVNGDYDEHYGHIGFKEGFKKAIELNKDKVFTEEQMFRMFLFGHSLSEAIKRGVIEDKPVGEIFNDRIQSLQQPTEIDVEIETEKTPVKMPGIMVFTKAPKLDSEGCLILKKI